jgi:hypothetical protein
MDEGSPDVYRLQVAGPIGEFFFIITAPALAIERKGLGKRVRLAYIKP